MMQQIDFQTASRAKVEEFYTWFTSTESERVYNFIKVVNQECGDNALDFTPNSLSKLAFWLKENVRHRVKTDAEVEQYKSSVPKWLEHTLKEPILTNEWIGRAIDVGTYIGAVFLKSFPFLSWSLSQQDRKHVSFGQPVLSAPSGFELPVLQIARAFLVGIYQFPDPAKRILSVYSYWEKALQLEKEKGVGH